MSKIESIKSGKLYPANCVRNSEKLCAIIEISRLFFGMK
jgi:hypothetical protein